MMEIKILGSGCVNCKKLEENAQKAVRELQVDSTIIKSTGYPRNHEIRCYADSGYCNQ